MGLKDCGVAGSWVREMIACPLVMMAHTNGDGGFLVPMMTTVLGHPNPSVNLRFLK